MTWPRPVPLVGDPSSAAERALDPGSWSLGAQVQEALQQVVAARRDVRRYRPDAVPEDVLRRVLAAGHAAPSVGHSQPWRFLVQDEPAVREQAALLADRERLAQAAQLEPDAARRLLDLQLEGIREAPLGVVVACDRRAPAAGVLGRATFPDADVWSCACAIQNMWLAARAEGLGMGWVTLFRPEDLAGLLGLPDQVVTLGWLCLGWPDERPPAPGLERAGWSRRAPLSDVVVRGRWPAADVAAPQSRLRAPGRAQVVAARDAGDVLLTPPGSLGLLDRAVDRLLAAGVQDVQGALVLAAGRHPVTRHGVTAYRDRVTEDVLAASAAGTSLAAVAARTAGLELRVLDGGASSGDLVTADAMAGVTVDALLERGRAVDVPVAALGEVGVGNTTVAAVLACALLGLAPQDAVGLGAGADSAILARKAQVVAAALARPGSDDPLALLARLGGPEVALLTGVVLGAASRGHVVVLDGLLTGVAALLAVRLEPGAAAYLVAGQRSRERAAAAVLGALGLEPLLDLRLRCGEGVGAALAVQLLRSGLAARRETARTA